MRPQPDLRGGGVTPYLYPRQRQIEVLAALYAGGMGVYIGMSEALGIMPPVGWLGLTAAGRVALAEVLVAAAVAHGIGIRVNGAWRCSPCLRLLAMLVMAAVGAFAVYKGGGSSASYTYGWITAFLAIGAGNALRDSMRSLRGATWRPI